LEGGWGFGLIDKSINGMLLNDNDRWRFQLIVLKIATIIHFCNSQSIFK
jgi:hypothetical protein